MADEYSKVLISPDGDEFTARSPREANDLMFGSGYREKEAAATKSSKKADRSGEGTT